MVLLLTACTSSSPSATAPTRPSFTPQAGDHELTLSSGGSERRYRVHAPAGYDGSKPVPVVIGLHFYPGDGQGMQEMIGLDAHADKAGFLTVYPDGVNGAFNALVCCGQQDDVAFVKALVDELKSVWKADPDRIYLTGISNGGDMSLKLAVELPDTFAAIAPVSGGFIGTKASEASYAPKSPVSVLTFIGGQDRYASQFDSGIQAWQQRAGCTPSAPAAVPGPAMATRTVAPCEDGSEVVVYRLPKMGHSWPGAQQGQLADADAGVAATDLIWEFFAAHPRLRG
ncbi:extracellular catalytic domain type 1 short-chain-length polyhydroxyalkanoate depolymerase [Micromonospora sp. CPCC 206061]|uniref:extracellular catalytic domain type 1 short-chain-length polyhydroxyalkanoate depolymerase n=1 Tax=Micromonospora sp. CPCC 206061 TaxID=3122410 RepID=UPI002FEF2FE9